MVDVQYHDSFQELREKYKKNTFFYATTKAKKFYTEAIYNLDDFLVFGPETRGLPEEILKDNELYCVRIPMISQSRSLNLSNSVAILVYEALRQQISLIWFRRNKLAYSCNIRHPFTSTFQNLPKEVWQGIDGADLIYAGDVNTLEILEDLAHFAPVKAVLGNTDPYELAINYPRNTYLMLDSIKSGLFTVTA